jgi:hypothetical protein
MMYKRLPSDPDVAKFLESSANVLASSRKRMEETLDCLMRSNELLCREPVKGLGAALDAQIKAKKKWAKPQIGAF